MDVALRYYLNAQSSYVKSAPVVIRFTLENLSSKDVWILKWYTPLEGIKGKIFDIKCNGVDIPYEGRLMKRGNPEIDDYIRLLPKGLAYAEVDLSQAYSLPVCKECWLKFKGRIYDAVFDERQVPRASNEHQRVDIPGNAVVFSIVIDHA